MMSFEVYFVLFNRRNEECFLYKNICISNDFICKDRKFNLVV